MTGNAETAPGPSEAPAAATPAASEIDRMAVKITHLDTLLGLTGEIIIEASNLSIIQRSLANGQATADKDTTEMIKQACLTTGRISSDLHHLVMDIRMVAIRDTFLRFRRLVRDIARKRGRQVNLEIVGEDTLVDKTVAERLYEPLAHQIRNAIDHGLEDPLERQHAGKNPTGTLTLSAYKKEDFTFVAVSDDGQGIDENRIRQVAVEKSIVTPEEAARLSGPECWALIMRPGFSTAREATEISGRGVGMDVVKSTVESIGGEVLIDTRPGQGSTFTYKIPELSAVNITDAVVIRAGENHYAVPIGNVVATLAVTADKIHTAMGGRDESIMYLGGLLPLHDLNQVLSGAALSEPAEPGDAVSVLIVEAKNGRVAFRVSEFVRPQKLVLIPMPDGFEPKGIAGTTILGGAQVGMIVEPFQLVAMAQGTSLDETPESARAFEDWDPGVEASAPPAPAAASAEAAKAESGAPAARKAAPAAATESEGTVDNEVAEEFFIEIQEILKTLNEDIFQLERAPEDLPRINTIFRHFHSIKGNFIMTGFAGVGKFVHQLETVLDQMREKTLAVNQEIIDLLLDAVKNLEQGLQLIRHGKNYTVDDENLLQLLARYKRQPSQILPREDTETDGVFRFSPLGTLLYNAKRCDPDCRVFQSLIQLRPSFQDPSLVAYLIVKRLTLLGEIIDTAPGLDRIENGLVGEKIKVMFSSRHSLDEVNRFFTRQLVKHFSVEGFENLVMD